MFKYNSAIKKMLSFSPFCSYKSKLLRHYSYNRHETIIGILQKQKILLRGAMIKKRTTNFLFLNNFLPTYSYSYSELAGHGAFISMALSYSETDFMMLRAYASTG